MKPQTYVFFGQVGSGKGTQIKLLAKYLESKDNKEVVSVGTGDAFRKLLSTDSFTAKLVRDSLNRGELQPNFLTTSLFTNILISSLDEEKHLIADGYPRTVEQSESFEKMMVFFKRENVKIIFIELSEEEAMRRNLLRGRTDDTEEGLRKRFNEYKNNVMPAMKYFDGKDGYEVLTISGEQSVEYVQKDIINKLGFSN